jgi:hypothetical protein
MQQLHIFVPFPGNLSGEGTVSFALRSTSAAAGPSSVSACASSRRSATCYTASADTHAAFYRYAVTSLPPHIASVPYLPPPPVREQHMPPPRPDTHGGVPPRHLPLCGACEPSLLTPQLDRQHPADAPARPEGKRCRG